MVRSSSAARPTRGSIFPSSAALVRSLPNSSKVTVFPDPPPREVTPTRLRSSFSWSSLIISSGIFDGSTPNFSKILTAFPLSSLRRANKM
eukprot:Skav235226  [mRNA]  locus=scaffold3995:182180:184411:- [translate_table: standard]